MSTLDDTSINVAIGDDISVLVEDIDTDPTTLCSTFSINFDNTIDYMGKQVEVYLR